MEILLLSWHVYTPSLCVSSLTCLAGRRSQRPLQQIKTSTKKDDTGASSTDNGGSGTNAGSGTGSGSSTGSGSNSGSDSGSDTGGSSNME